MDRVFLILADGFRRQGHRVTLLACRFDPAVVSAVAQRAIQVPSLAAEDPEAATRAWLENAWDEHFSGSNRPDIVLVGGWPFFSSIPLLRSRCAQVVFSDHGAVPIEGQPASLQPVLRLLAILRRRYLANCSAIVAVSQFIAQSQSLPDTEQQVRCDVIYNGADHLQLPIWQTPLLADSTTQAPTSDSLQQVKALKAAGKKIVVSLGRWEPGTYKHSEEAFALADALRKKGVPCAIIVLAKPEALAAFPQKAADVVAVGNPDDKDYAEILRLADAGVCFSTWEGFNLPLAEMQWLDRPAFVMNQAAHPEVVCDPHFLAATTVELAAKIGAWLTSAAPALPNFAERCATFRGRFQWQAAIDRYLGFFSELLAAPSAGQPDPAWWGSTLVIDVTNSTRDPANSGVIRVTRRLSRTLQRYCEPLFVVWERDQHRWVLPTQAEFEVLGRFNGPKLAHPRYSSPAGHRITLESFLAVQAQRGGWLLLPETIQEQDAEVFRQTTKALGLQTANIFYDAIPLLMPELCNAEILANHSRYMRGLANLDVVIPISQFSGDCLREHWQKEGVTGAQIVPDLLPAEFGGATRVSAIPPPPSGTLEMLCVSTLEPRKNHARLIEACLGLERQQPGLKWRMTFVGNSYAGKPEITHEIQALCQRDPRFRWLGILDDAQLAELYRAATFTVYPSFIEGYGMPIMESVWFGRPCICHEKGVMAELAAGGGCLTANVLDPASLRDAILRLATDANLYRQLAAAAVARPVKSWREYGEEFLQTLAGATAERQRRNWERTLFPDCLLDGWQMSDSERAGMFTVLARTRPRCAIEIGTYKGGSLSLISQLSQTVFSIDIDPTIPDRFSFFKNVSFFTGPSTVIMPALLAELDAADMAPEFILVDGDHSENGVRDDLNCILAYRPKRPLFVIMHDSFNPICRRGILAANWAESRYLQYLDTDFVPGRLTENGSIFDGEVWGGLALAYFTPEPRFGPPRMYSSATKLQATLVAQGKH